ncbi:MAG: helix-turn-helix domain-containing protein, partial [Spirochaetia bacterium]
MAKTKLIKGRIFFRILQLSLIPMLIFSVISIIWYIYYVYQFESRLIIGYRERIKSAIHEINSSITNILYSSNIVLDDRSIRTISESGDILKPGIYMMVVEGCELLNYFRITNPMIKNVYFYHLYNDLLLSSDGTESITRTDLKERFYSEVNVTRIPHSLGYVHLAYTGSNLTLIINQYGFDTRPDPLIIELETSVIKGVVQKYNPTENSTVSLSIENFGNILAADHEFSKSEITNQGDQSGFSDTSYRIKIKGGIELYFRTPNTIWGTTVAATFIPSGDIRREFRFFHIIFLSILCAGLIAAFIISWVMSSGIYRPVHTIITSIQKNNQYISGEESLEGAINRIRKEDLSTVSKHVENLLHHYMELKKEVTTLLPAASEHYLLALMQDTGESESEPVMFLRNNNIQFTLPKFCVAVCAIFPTQAFLKEHKFNEIEHLAHGLFKLLQNSLQPEEQLFSIHLEGGKYALLFNIQNELHEKDIQKKIEGMIKILEPERYLFRIHSGIGRTYTGLSGLQKSYSEARRAETVAAASGKETIRIFQIYGKPHGLTFTNDEIHRLENHLERSEYGKAESLCGSIVERNLKGNIAEEPLKELYLQFIFIALRVAENRNIIEDIPVEKNILTLASSFKTLDIQDVKLKTESYLQTVCRLLEKGTGKIDPKNIIEYIEENYTRDIYLDEMAERFGTSSSYISRYFKQTVGVNFHRYLSNLRIQEAKNLLQSTNRTVSDISSA